MPFLPRTRSAAPSQLHGFDAGRGCPFRCSFCTIINVQGRKSRYRDADDVERIVRANVAQGVNRFFITDDNMARNKNWEAIFDRLIELREQRGPADQLPHAGRYDVPQDSGLHREGGSGRLQSRVHRHGERQPREPDRGQEVPEQDQRIPRDAAGVARGGVITYAGYILGFPADTPESIERDIRVIQHELPIDILEFFILTPLPGSADHQDTVPEGRVDGSGHEQVRRRARHHPPSRDDGRRVDRDLRPGLAPVLHAAAHRDPHAPRQGDGVARPAT